MIGAWVQGVSESLKVRCSLHSQHTDTDPPLTDTKGVRSCLNVCCLWFILIKQLLPSRLRMRLMSHRARIPSLHCPRHHHQRNVCTLSKNQSQQCLVGGGQRDNACRFQAPQCLKQLFCSEADHQPGALESAPGWRERVRHLGVMSLFFRLFPRSLFPPDLEVKKELVSSSGGSGLQHVATLRLRRSSARRERGRGPGRMSCA